MVVKRDWETYLPILSSITNKFARYHKNNIYTY